MATDSFDKLVEEHPLMGPAWRERQAEIAAAPQASKPPAVSCIEWMDALAGNYARTAEAIFDDPRLTREGKLRGVSMLFLEARRLPERASIRVLNEPG